MQYIGVTLMARTVVPLTNTQVNQAKSKSKEYSLSDGRGLALRVKPNGSKLWIFNYTRPHTRKRANLSFGIYPEISLAEARKEREKARELLAQGIDPKAGRDHTKAEKVRQQATTLEIVSRQWWDLKRRKITADYADDVIGSLEKHVFPKLGAYPLSDLTAPDVISALQPLVKAGKLEMIKRLCSRLNQVMTYANNSGVVVGNPLAGIRHAFESPTVTHNPTLRPDELPELMDALKHANIRRTTYLLILWQLHTMTRPGEAAGARWNEIDSERKLWVIPENRTKKRRIHIVPLSPPDLTATPMTRSVVALTNTQVNQTKPKAKDYNHL